LHGLQASSCSQKIYIEQPQAMAMAMQQLCEIEKQKFPFIEEVKMSDYAEALIKISEYRKKAQLAILAKNWSEACDFLDLIVDSANEAKIFSMAQLNMLMGTQIGTEEHQ
jgi:hypothetical protein